MQTVLITGGTGLVGRHLTQHLINKGYNIVILTRSVSNKENNNFVRHAAWDVKKQTIDVEAVQSADFIVHLAGAGVVDKRWTKAYKQEIMESRTLSGKLLIDTLKNNTHKVKAFISSSAIGWYGKDMKRDYSFVEADEPAGDFLGQTCLLWEQAVDPAQNIGIRVCKIRTGIVLSKDGGALDEFKKPLRFGIAAILSSGKQVVSWVHIDDLCRIFTHAIENEKMKGSYNAVAPRPETNKILTLMLAKSLRGTHFIPMHVPAFVLKLVMGESSIEVLKSTTVSSAKIKETGFTFLYPSLDAALENLAEKKY